jgi:thiamine biosynthesis lipoprotein
MGLTDQSLVTVIARDCTTADSLATAASVLGPAEGLRLLEATRGVSGQLVRKPAERLEAIETRDFTRHLDEN